KRFGSATDMIDALEEAARIIVPQARLQPLHPYPEIDLQTTSVNPCNNLDQFVMELVNVVSGKAQTPDQLKVRFSLQTGRHLELSGRLGKSGDALPIFDDFCRQWHAKAIPQEDGLVIQAINAAPSVWQWLLGR